MPKGTFNITFEYTQNKQQYDTKITRTEIRKQVIEMKKKKSGFFWS